MIALVFLALLLLKIFFTCPCIAPKYLFLYSGVVQKGISLIFISTRVSRGSSKRVAYFYHLQLLQIH